MQRPTGVFLISGGRKGPSGEHQDWSAIQLARSTEEEKETVGVAQLWKKNLKISYERNEETA